MSSEAANFIVGAKSVAVTSGLVALGSLATLAIVVGVKQVDILSTVALALAILAFVVQLIVYVVQSASATQQLSDARTLHGEMMSVLAELQTRSAGTQRSIDSLHDQMVSDLRLKAAGPDAQPPSSRNASNAPPEPAQSRRVRVAPSQHTGGLNSTVTQYPEPPPDEVAAAIQEQLASWPTVREMEEEIVPLLQSKDNQFLNALRWIVTDTLNFAKPGGSIGPGIDIASTGVAAMVEEGLAEKIPGWKLATPTARGRDVGRIFTAPDPPPPGTPAEIVNLRDRMLPKSEDPNRFRES